MWCAAFTHLHHNGASWVLWLQSYCCYLSVFSACIILCVQVSFIKANWEVDVTVTDFSGWLFDTVDLMQRSDLLIGMHGAGMTNVYFLPEVCIASSPAACSHKGIVIS